jgi:uncharacterized protein YbaR (Trm112 family)
MAEHMYAHILVFACPDCNRPLAISHLSEERNLESIDAQKLKIICPDCKSATNVLAATAKRHMVQRWNSLSSSAVSGK